MALKIPDCIYIRGDIAKGGGNSTSPLVIMTPGILIDTTYIAEISATDPAGAPLTNVKYQLVDAVTGAVIVELKKGTSVADLITAGGASVIAKADEALEGFRIALDLGATGAGADVSFNFFAILITYGYEVCTPENYPAL